MSSYKVLIPYYTHPHYLDQLMDSMDIDYSHIIIVDNSKDQDAKKYVEQGVKVVPCPDNMGVSRSWNIGLRANADWTFLVSIACCFPNGFSEVLAQMWQANEYCFLTTMAWHCNAISRKCVDLVGEFDENFYPAYYEDTDYYRRMNLAGVPYNGYTPIPAYAITIANSVSAEVNNLNVNYQAQADYYKEKWGGYPGGEKWDIPFDGEGYAPSGTHNDLKYWKAETIPVLKERYRL